MFLLCFPSLFSVFFFWRKVLSGYYDFFYILFVDYVPLEKDEEVEKVLGKEGVKEALSDAQIQQLFSHLREDPTRAQRSVCASVD